jgi:hypothetical protein
MVAAGAALALFVGGAMGWRVWAGRDANGRQQATDSRRQTADGGRQAADGGRQAADGGRQAADGGRQAADGRWQTADSSRQTADGGQQAADGLQPAGYEGPPASRQPSAGDVPPIAHVSARELRARYSAVAAAAPDDYPATAAAVLASGATLAEKVAVLRAAEDAAPAALDAVYATALDTGRTRDPVVREIAAGRLIRRAGKDPVARARLLASVVADASAPEALRDGAAAAVFASVPEDQAERLLRDVEGLRDVPWPAVVRGLSLNASPRVRERAAEVSRGLWWVPLPTALAEAPADEGTE